MSVGHKGLPCKHSIIGIRFLNGGAANCTHPYKALRRPLAGAHDHWIRSGYSKWDVDDMEGDLIGSSFMEQGPAQHNNAQQLIPHLEKQWDLTNLKGWGLKVLDKIWRSVAQLQIHINLSPPLEWNPDLIYSYLLQQHTAENAFNYFPLVSRHPSIYPLSITTFPVAPKHTGQKAGDTLGITIWLHHTLKLFYSPSKHHMSKSANLHSSK